MIELPNIILYVSISCVKHNVKPKAISQSDRFANFVKFNPHPNFYITLK